MRTDPKNVTFQDLQALRQIELCGFIRIEGRHGWMETGRPLSWARLERLRRHGFLAPSSDSMFGSPSQTWRLTDGTKTAEIKRGPVRRPEGS